MNKKKNAAHPRRHYKPHIHTGVFLWFIAFSAIMVAVLWAVQIFFLDDIYIYSTERRMEDTANGVTAALQDGSFETETLADLTKDNRFSLSLYKILEGEDGIHPLTVFESNFPGAMSEFLPKAEYRALLRELYAKATLEADQNVFASVGEGNEKERTLSRLFYGSLYEKNGESFLFVIEAELLPVTATVHLLEIVLIFFTVLFLLFSILISFFASKNISAPLVSITEAARDLPKGSFSPLDGTPYREISELSDTLSDVAEELRKADRYHMELIANVSHDLRTPRTTVIGYSEVMRDVKKERTPENLQVVIDEAQHLSDFVQDLLALSRVQAGASGQNKEYFDLDKLLNETVLRYQRLKSTSGFVFRYHTAGAATVYADRIEISQVVCNLLNNAVNYSGDSREIDISLKKDANFVTVAVRDYGIGIEEGELSRIFDRYYKVDKTHERARVGSGIGLSIVKRILESYSAPYGAVSTPSVGSSFYFKLPYREESASLPEPEQQNM